MGFEPTVPFSITGFQDRLLKPLGHLSLNAEMITKTLRRVKINIDTASNLCYLVKSIRIFLAASNILGRPSGFLPPA